ncbi:unnamed protein product [Linum trigynum]|uniref:F-box domain-containing protein n=1 Tax=Linum trigynum TaxID=586398 RepID=A0AAV2D2Z7_9ROSI
MRLSLIKTKSSAGQTSQVRRRPVNQWLPEELQLGILSRLPTPASIARFRCVSKSWRRLLSDDPEFIAKILFSDDGDLKGDEEAQVLTLDAFQESYSIHSCDTLRPVSSGRLPRADTGFLPRVAGCSGGIFCITDYINKGEIILWNPTTSEAKELMPIPSLSVSDDIGEVGFGFDPVTEDYKVIVWFWDHKSTHEIYVYSLRKNKWRRLRHYGSAAAAAARLPAVPGYLVGPVASRAPNLQNCHWINPYYPEYLPLTTFDMSKEAFTVLRLPVPPVEHPRGATSSFHLVKGGSSCLVAVYSGTRTKATSSIFLEVWVALDYEALERKECSWIRLYDVEVHDLIPAARPWLQSAAGVWEHGRFFVRWSCEKGKIDIDTENGAVDHKWDRRFLEHVVYVPSTVSLARRKKSLIRRANDNCRSICRTVTMRRRGRIM